MASPDLSVFGRIKTKQDYDRLNEEFQMRKNLANQRLMTAQRGPDLPAAIQIANEYGQARAAGDLQRMRDLELAAKVFDKGLWSDSAGGVGAIGSEPTIAPQPISSSAPPSAAAPTANAPNSAPLGTLPAGQFNDFIDSMGASSPTPIQVAAANSVGQQPGYFDALSQGKAKVKGAEQNAKNASDLQYAAPIAAAEERAKPAAKALGEADAELNERIARQPQLNNVAQRLSQLGQAGTYTVAGQVWDNLNRQSGGRVRDAATARAEYIAVVDNEVLPLLRQTFGAQFTKEEGNSLKTTLGDPNKSPEEKDAVLRSFIRTKMETANSLARQTGKPEPFPAGDVEAQVNSIGAAPEPQAIPQKGAVVDGYIFMGGSPADKKNWKKK